MERGILLKNYKIAVIGLGGIGTNLINILCRFLNFTKTCKSSILLIDGDEYESHNLDRQEFQSFGGKAEEKFKELSRKFNIIDFNFCQAYINKSNINSVLKNINVIFMCVDNHKTRKIVSDYCKTLDNILLISGGNEYIDGNVQIYLRKNGIDITPSLTDYHPEIENPEDKSPHEMSCEELSVHEPQLLFTNSTVANLMMWPFYYHDKNDTIEISEIYFDILKMKADSKVRHPKEN